MKKQRTILLTCMLTAVMNITAFAEWKQDENGYWYEKGGTYVANAWEQIDGNWYHFDPNGYMQTGWQYIDGSWYYLHENGAMAHDTWIGEYYLKSSGKMAVNEFTPDGYYVDADGKWKAGVKNPRQAYEDFVYSGEYLEYASGWDGSTRDYEILDINQDNIPELFIGSSTGWDYYTLIFTFDPNANRIVYVDNIYSFRPLRYSNRYKAIAFPGDFRPSDYLGVYSFQVLNGTHLESLFSVYWEYDGEKMNYGGGINGEITTEGEKDAYFDELQYIIFSL